MRAVGVVLISALVLWGAALPKEGPLPVARPDTDQGEQPTPTPKPAAPQRKPQASDQKNLNVGAGKDLPPGWKDDSLREEALLTIEKEDPKAYASCLAALKEIGSAFAETARIDDGKGCGIDRPIRVRSVLPGVALEPEGVMRCETALALARWVKETAAPAAKAAFGADARLSALNQASTYVCRLRNNAETGKISEHARGNAVDIASFSLADGKTVEIQPRDEDGTLTGAFQRAVTASGCLYFTTVLDPGSDAAHETHLHFDVIERKNGYRYCR
ncbi:MULTISPECIES: extensin family protein [Sinorhizobium]|uniref:extensin-like domain-containing protein n=1 Tax=Sinorhizobium TaxID=28105 RepID=UPI000BE7CAA0|nr:MULTISPECIES: extensin family protein [Sinorhizobium]PDT54371.1 extensin [Sinorhizobium sp. NG07B]POH31422.1 extensin [Sinorhizobium americanum]